jgi:hypothetical protein
MPTAPTMSPGPVKSPAMRHAHLDVKMAPGWRYESTRRCFVAADGREFSPVADLPKSVRIVHMVPALAAADPQTLTEDERNLARYVQVVFATKASRKKYWARVEAWPCAEEVRLPPEVSLP